MADAPQLIKDRALGLALTAVRLDQDDGRCHQFLAQAYLYRREFDMALSHFERSVALNPNDANGLAQMGVALAFVGRAEEGIELIHQAMRLNPFHPEWYWTDLAIASYAAHRYEEALDANRRLAGHGKPWYLARLAACYAQLGQMGEARAQAAKVLQLKPDFHLADMNLVTKIRPTLSMSSMECARRAYRNDDCLNRLPACGFGPVLMLWTAPPPARKCHEGRRRLGDPESRACLLLAHLGLGAGSVRGLLTDPKLKSLRSISGRPSLRRSQFPSSAIDPGAGWPSFGVTTSFRSVILT